MERLEAETLERGDAVHRLAAVIDQEVPREAAHRAHHLGQRGEVPDLVASVLETSGKPLVVDADALNALSASGRVGLLHQRSLPTIATPHPGEFARLLRTTTAAVQQDRAGLAARFAREHGVILLLKGARTVVTDGWRLYENSTGNPGMATGGSGDVLTGLLAALLGQGLDAFAAACLGAHLHGLAGDLARNARGEVSLIATDLLEYLPGAFRSLATR